MAILLYLLAKGRVSFTELYRELNLTPGNAWSHLEKMEREDLVKIEKTFTPKGPVTYVIITEKGYEIAEELVAILSSLSKLGDVIPSGSESSESS
ncbi:transcriptional regulator [Ignicoccus islandicus]|uniref:transcriptional regulator n=1 Tax=Ignicoccus islandicus TaxID=54259 RepID=UPI001F458244|nr:transcriptional regulator [Ignicoccus islandicus]